MKRLHFWLTWFFAVVGSAFTAYLALNATPMETWIGALSIYACVGQHWGAYQAACAENAAKAAVEEAARMQPPQQQSSRSRDKRGRFAKAVDIKIE